MHSQAPIGALYHPLVVESAKRDGFIPIASKPYALPSNEHAKAFCAHLISTLATNLANDMKAEAVIGVVKSDKWEISPITQTGASGARAFFPSLEVEITASPCAVVVSAPEDQRAVVVFYLFVAGYRKNGSGEPDVLDWTYDPHVHNKGQLSA